MKISPTASVKVRRVSEPREPSDRPYSPYNLYYILEHRLLLQEKGVVLEKESSPDGDNDLHLGDMNSYCSVNIPTLPSRYRSLVLPKNWFVHGKKKEKRREHRKAHGVISFTELSRVVAARWKCIDDETFQYVKRVSLLIHKKWEENRLRTAAKLSPRPHSSGGREHQPEGVSIGIDDKSLHDNECNQEKKAHTDGHSSVSTGATSNSTLKNQSGGNSARRLSCEYRPPAALPSYGCAQYKAKTTIGAIRPLQSHMHPYYTTSEYFTAHRAVTNYKRFHSITYLQRELATMHDLVIIQAEKLRCQDLQLRALIQSGQLSSNYIPSATTDAPWTHQEELLLVKLLREYPNQLTLMMSYFPERNKSFVIDKIIKLYKEREQALELSSNSLFV